MESSEKDINIQFSEKALKFIKAKRLHNPLVLVNLGYRSGGGDSSGGGCSGGGGGCGEGEPASASVPYPNVVMVDGGDPGGQFVRVDTQAGIPVYLSKAVFNLARRGGNPLFITLKGLVMKRLSLEGLDVTSPADQDPGEGPSCH